MSINNLSSSGSSSRNDLKNLSYDELQKKLQDASLKDDIIAIADEISIRENLWNNSAIDQIKKSKNKLTRSELKSLLSAHIQEYVRNKWLNNNQATNTAKDKKIEDLMKQLQESNGKNQELERKYNDKLMEDEKMIKIMNPVERGRRKYLRNTLNKFKSFFSKDPKKALAYFLTTTRFWKWWKLKASLKKASLFMKNLTNFSTMWEKQILENKKDIQKAIDDMNPKADDTPTVKDLKTQIRKEVAESANKYFDWISKPLETKIAA